MTKKRKTKKDTIKLGTHRGKAALKYYVNSTIRSRVIDQTRDTEDQIDELWDEIRAGDGKPARNKSKPKRTLDEHTENWHADLLTVAKPKQADTAIKRVRRTLSEARIADIDQISVAKVRTAISRLRCTPRKPKTDPEKYPLLSERSRHHYSRAIKQFTRWLTHEGYCEVDPLRRWRLSKVKTERNPRDRLQPQEVAKLIQTTRASSRCVEGYDGPTRALLYTLAVMTGLRRGELATLVPASFDWDTRTVTVAGGHTKNGDPAHLPLHHQLNGELRAWIASRTGQLFPGLRHKRTRQMMMKDMAEAGLPYRTKAGTRCFHALRNTFISALLDVSPNVATVQRLARHSDVRLTMKYGKPRSGELAVIDELAYPAFDRVQD